MLTFEIGLCRAVIECRAVIYITLSTLTPSNEWGRQALVVHGIFVGRSQTADVYNNEESIDICFTSGEKTVWPLSI